MVKPILKMSAFWKRLFLQPIVNHSCVTLVCEHCWISINIMRYDASEVYPSVCAGRPGPVIAMTREQPMCSARDAGMAVMAVGMTVAVRAVTPLCQHTDF